MPSSACSRRCEVHEIGTASPASSMDRHSPQGQIAPAWRNTGFGWSDFSGAALSYGVQETKFEDVPARITSPARTVVDCFRYERHIGRETALDALQDALKDRKVKTGDLNRVLESLPSRRLSAILESGVL